MSRETGKALLVAVTGGSASGKSSLAEAIAEGLSTYETRMVREDDYYLDHGASPGFDPLRFNFDDKSARDHDLLIRHLQQLKSGKSVQAPVYDFATHRRLDKTRTIRPADVILVEGIHVLSDEALARQFDLRIYVSASADIRLARRLIRDVAERGRNLQSVVTQYLRTVRPMHEKHTAPAKASADIVIVNDAAEAEPELQALWPSFHKMAEPAVQRIEKLLGEAG